MEIIGFFVVLLLGVHLFIGGIVNVYAMHAFTGELFLPPLTLSVIGGVFIYCAVHYSPISINILTH